MSPVPILHPGLVHQTQVGLVNQARGAQRVIAPLRCELPVGHPPELVVHHGEQPVERGAVAGAQLEQEIGNDAVVATFGRHCR